MFWKLRLLSRGLLARMLGLLCISFIALPAFALPPTGQWPAKSGGGAGGQPAVAWYSITDEATMNATMAANNTFVQFTESGNFGFEEIFDPLSRFAYNSGTGRICYTGSTSVFVLNADLTIHSSAASLSHVFTSFGVNGTSIGTVNGTSPGQRSYGLHVVFGTTTTNGAYEGLAPVSQMATLNNGDCIGLFGATDNGGNNVLTLASGSISIQEVTPTQTASLGFGPVTNLTATRSITAQEMSGGVIQKTATGAMTLTLNSADCTSGKSVTVIDSFGNGAITIDIPTGYRADELTNANGDNLASSGAYGEAISLICTGADAKSDGLLDVLVMGLKGSWIDAN